MEDAALMEAKPVSDLDRNRRSVYARHAFAFSIPLQTHESGDKYP
jgi:hypothetical protein